MGSSEVEKAPENWFKTTRKNSSWWHLKDKVGWLTDLTSGYCSSLISWQKVICLAAHAVSPTLRLDGWCPLASVVHPCVTFCHLEYSLFCIYKPVFPSVLVSFPALAHSFLFGLGAKKKVWPVFLSSPFVCPENYTYHTVINVSIHQWPPNNQSLWNVC